MNNYSIHRRKVQRIWRRIDDSSEHCSCLYGTLPGALHLVVDVADQQMNLILPLIRITAKNVVYVFNYINIIGNSFVLISNKIKTKM